MKTATSSVIGHVAPRNAHSAVRQELVRVEALRFFNEAVLECGGDTGQLMAELELTPEILEQPDGVLPYRQMVLLLERAAKALNCPDFGLRLGRRQHSVGILGPLDIAMRNSRTLGEAFRYCSDHIYTYCASTYLGLAHDQHGHWILRFEILLDRLPAQRQATEHALLVTHLAIIAMSGAKAQPREVWMRHDPVAPFASYRAQFGVPVRFGQPYNALVLDERDEALPICGRSSQLYELATKFIDAEFPKPDTLFSSRVKSTIRQQLSVGGRLHGRVAAALRMHPRTLQRRLREEGACFETLRNEVRRELAWHHLNHSDMPLSKLAALLGYSELSTFSKSCTRWFAHSPSKLRQQRAKPHATAQTDHRSLDSG